MSKLSYSSFLGSRERGGVNTSKLDTASNQTTQRALNKNKKEKAQEKTRPSSVKARNEKKEKAVP
jgi:hypothetical protein